jgi:hypothetical protein
VTDSDVKLCQLPFTFLKRPELPWVEGTVFMQTQLKL